MDNGNTFTTFVGFADDTTVGEELASSLGIADGIDDGIDDGMNEGLDDGLDEGNDEGRADRLCEGSMNETLRRTTAPSYC